MNMNKLVLNHGSKIMIGLAVFLLFVLYSVTAPKNHSEAEDVYDFALKVEQGTFADQAGVNRVLGLPMFGMAYEAAQFFGYSGRALPFMIVINRMLAVSCIVLFYGVLSYRRDPVGFELCNGSPVCTDEITSPAATKILTSKGGLQATLLLAFSYGFWRYANEAETYILASLFVLGAWYFVIKQTAGGRPQVGPFRSDLYDQLFAIIISSVGILIHLLNLIPLLLIIPLYYLLSKNWKKAWVHGVSTGLFVIVGYAICSPGLDFGELGAQHHAAEGAISLKNMMRGGIAFGQALISGNFLLGFESFREFLSRLFASRMLGDEFFMASYMPKWIPWAGIMTFSLFGVWGLWVGVCRWKHKAKIRQRMVGKNPRASNLDPFTISLVVWLILYAFAVIRTEAGSPELWIMALVPFWFLFAMLMYGDGFVGPGVGSMRRVASFFLIIFLFMHNLLAGLLPVMSSASDYHIAKGAWLLEHTTEDDLILTSYEPIFIFYLNYYTSVTVINSGSVSIEQITDDLDKIDGDAYALDTFFHPLRSMKYRNPALYEKMLQAGNDLNARFVKVVDDEFGGIWKLKKP